MDYAKPDRDHVEFDDVCRIWLYVCQMKLTDDYDPILLIVLVCFFDNIHAAKCAVHVLTDIVFVYVDIFPTTITFYFDQFHF